MGWSKASRFTLDITCARRVYFSLATALMIDVHVQRTQSPMMLVCVEL